jgi:hypothetical protein
MHISKLCSTCLPALSGTGLSDQGFFKGALFLCWSCVAVIVLGEISSFVSVAIWD